MWGIVKKLDVGVERFGYWAGGFVTLTSVFSWVSTHLTALGSIKWPEAFFIGIFSALLVMLAAAGTLALYRYFRPLPLQSRPNLVAAKERYEAVRDTLVDERLRALDQKAEKIKDIEDILRPRTSGLLTVLTSPDASRLDQLNDDISNLGKGIRERLDLLSQKLEAEKTNLASAGTVLSRAIRARYTWEIVQKADDKLLWLTPKLLNADPIDYPSDAEWLADYEIWKHILNEIDTYMTHWKEGYTKLMSVQRSEYEDGSMLPPANSRITIGKNGNRYQMVNLIWLKYANSRREILDYLNDKSWELPF